MQKKVVVLGVCLAFLFKINHSLKVLGAPRIVLGAPNNTQKAKMLKQECVQSLRCVLAQVGLIRMSVIHFGPLFIGHYLNLLW